MALELPADLIERRPEEGARLIALWQLAQLRKAARRAGRKIGESALHDLRVAIRRLRATLGVYRAILPRRVVRRARRRLARVMDATSPARDVEVALGALAQLGSSAHEDRYVLGWLASRWHRLERRGLRRARRAIVDDLPAELRRLRRRLRKVRVDFAPSRPSFLSYAGAIIAAQSEQVGQALAVAGDQATDRALHRARLAVKRLRYLLEPLAEVTPALEPSIAPLVSLQRLLGELRDRRLLADRLTEDAQRAPRDLREGVVELAAHAAPS